MGAIYRQANRVIAWLGSGLPISHDAMDYIGARMEFVDQRSNFVGQVGISAQESQEARRYRTKLGLEHIFACEYWHRLWIAQEFILGEELLIACDERAITWADLSRFEEDFARTSMSLGLDIYIPGDASNHFYFRRRREESEGEVRMPLKSVSSLLTYLECRDVRDKVYGLLGLTSSELKVDYARSPAEVFWQAIESMEQPPTGMDVHTLFELGILMGVEPSASVHHEYQHEYDLCSSCAHSDNPVIRRMWKEMDFDPHWNRDGKPWRCDVEYCEGCLGNMKTLWNTAPAEHVVRNAW